MSRFEDVEIADVTGKPARQANWDLPTDLVPTPGRRPIWPVVVFSVGLLAGMWLLLWSSNRNPDMTMYSVPGWFASWPIIIGSFTGWMVWFVKGTK